MSITVLQFLQVPISYIQCHRVSIQVIDKKSMSPWAVYWVPLRSHSFLTAAPDIWLSQKHCSLLHSLISSTHPLFIVVTLLLIRLPVWVDQISLSPKSISQLYITDLSYLHSVF